MERESGRVGPDSAPIPHQGPVLRGLPRARGNFLLARVGLPEGAVRLPFLDPQFHRAELSIAWIPQVPLELALGSNSRAPFPVLGESRPEYTVSCISKAIAADVHGGRTKAPCIHLEE